MLLALTHSPRPTSLPQIPPSLETRGSRFIKYQEARIQEAADEVRERKGEGGAHEGEWAFRVVNGYISLCAALLVSTHCSVVNGTWALKEWWRQQTTQVADHTGKHV
jgi:hypothetical protein